MTTHPVFLEKLIDKRTHEEIAPVHDLPKYIHMPIEHPLVIFVSILPVPQCEGEVSCKQPQHGEGESKCGTVHKVRLPVELVRACISDQYCHCRCNRC